MDNASLGNGAAEIPTRRDGALPLGFEDHLASVFRRVMKIL